MRSWRDVNAPPVEFRTVRIGDLTIHDIDFQATVAEIVHGATTRAGWYVCTPNVDHVVKARKDFLFREATEAARLRVPDGMWIIYASRIAGRPLRSTVTGRLLLPAVAAEARRHGLRLAVFGAGPGVAAQAADALRRAIPGVDLVAAVTPPTPFLIGSEDDGRAVAELAAADPDVIFVCLGAPKQEIWMARHADALSGAVLVGAGAALDVLAGRFREAPRWMTRWGLEWLWRLGHEPRRLARRYLVDDPWILWWAVRTRFSSQRG
jgi:N-acetylglucosaminyldiphosphoundecaprenol N-acetyl-beta-D-mannosaminyltransferase